MSSLESLLCLEFVEMRFGLKHREIASQISKCYSGQSLGEIMSNNVNKINVDEVDSVLLK